MCIRDRFFDNIWEMFKRLHTQEEYEGSGLGLATCKKIVDSLGGQIHIKSKVGEGSLFQIKLPNSYLANKSRTSFTIEDKKATAISTI